MKTADEWARDQILRNRRLNGEYNRIFALSDDEQLLKELTELETNNPDIRDMVFYNPHREIARRTFQCVVEIKKMLKERK